jgi:hypothetical protein
MSSGNKRQQTMAKRNRELEVEERRTRKREKKRAAAAARNEGAAGEAAPGEPIGDALDPPQAS